MAFKYWCSDCGKYFLSFLPSWKCPECQGKMYQCDYQVEVSAKLEKQIKAEAIKEFAERLKEKHRRIMDYDEAGFGAQIFIFEERVIDNLLKEMVGDKE